MAAPASEDLLRRRWRRDDDVTLVEEEEGEIVPGYHSDTDTDEYYNSHFPREYDDEADSGRRAASSVVVPANNGGHASTFSVEWGWGGTDKRGRPGTAVSPSAQPDHQFMTALAAAAPKAVLQPVPLAFAPPPSSLPSSSVPTASGARTNHSGQRRTAQSVHDEAAVHQQPVAPPSRTAPAAGRQNPDGYTCGKCGMWFATHQGLGGHSVGHKHRERELVHVCGDCGAEFATGVQLGGHKRKHWAGAPIVPKKKPRAVVAVLDQHLPPPAGSAARAADVTLALAVKADETSLAATGTTTQPAARSPVAGEYASSALTSCQRCRRQRRGKARLRLRQIAWGPP